MKKATGLVMGGSILFGALVTGCGDRTGEFHPGYDKQYSPAELDEMQAHMKRDFDSNMGTLVHAPDPVRIQFQGDLYTLPTEGMKDGQTIPYDETEEVDLAKSQNGNNCVDLRLPAKEAGLNIKVAQNNSFNPVTVQVGGTAIRFCNDSRVNDATAVVEITQRVG